jgi:hypothetical protein
VSLASALSISLAAYRYKSMVLGCQAVGDERVPSAQCFSDAVQLSRTVMGATGVSAATLTRNRPSRLGT